MNRWSCNYPGCDWTCAGIGDAVGLEAIGWKCETDGTAYCPRHRRDAQSKEGHTRLERRVDLLQGILSDALRVEVTDERALLNAIIGAFNRAACNHACRRDERCLLCGMELQP